MIVDDKRIRIITGHYGSGKSEFAVNYVTRLRELVEGKVAIADMDVVNVYFRSRERKSLFDSMGIQLIGSSIEAETLDIPALSAGLMTPMRDKTYNYVIDLGGDNVGARVMGGYKRLIQENDYDLMFIINANREKTQTVQEVLNYIDIIEANAKLKVTKLVNNTHMLRETTLDDVLKGYKVAKEVSDITGIPLKYNTCPEALVDQVPKDLEGEIFPIKMYMRPEYL
jgi:hypothetical protein